MTLHLENQREQHVACWKASGKSRAAYCREHDIPYPAFISWIKQSTMTSQSLTPSGFIEVLRPPAHVPERQASPVVSVSFPNGVMMRVLVGTDANWIGRVVAAVRSC
jgi:hypothetical protein